MVDVTYQFLIFLMLFAWLFHMILSAFVSGKPLLADHTRIRFH